MKTENTDKATYLELLFKRVEDYSKTTIELIRLTTINKTAEVVSVLASHLLMLTLVAFFLFFINVGISLWIGEALGKMFLGFLIVALFYLIVGLLFYKFKKTIIEDSVNQIVIKTLLKPNEQEDEEAQL